MLIGAFQSELAASGSPPDRSRLRQSLANLREQYEGLQREHHKHRERHDTEIKAMNEEIDALVKEKMQATDQNRKTIIDLEHEHVKQIRRLRAEKEELEDEKHGMETVCSITHAILSFRLIRWGDVASGSDPEGDGSRTQQDQSFTA